MGLNNLEVSGRERGEALKISKIEEWSEFNSRRLSVLQYKLLGNLIIKMSRISGFLRGEVI